jgi:hypothetical protein
VDRHSQPQALTTLRLLDLGVTRHAAHLLERHQSGDWGDLEEDDWRENYFAVNRRLWTLSAYASRPTGSG